MTKVINVRVAPIGWSNDLNYAFIGRGSVFGNPFKKGTKCSHCGEVHKDAGSTIACFTAYFQNRLSKEPNFKIQVDSLKGKTLVCFCKPAPCHGDVIRHYLDETTEADDPAEVKNKKVIAIIGSREPTAYQKERVIATLTRLDPKKHQIVSGCADGIDSLALSTAFSMGFKTIGMIPWDSYNKHVQESCTVVQIFDQMNEKTVANGKQSVIDNHPAAHNLSQGAMKLHMRNYGIIRWADEVYAMPSNKPGGGGTGQGIRLAKDLSIICYITKP